MRCSEIVFIFLSAMFKRMGKKYFEKISVCFFRSSIFDNCFTSFEICWAQPIADDELQMSYDRNCPKDVTTAVTENHNEEEEHKT